MSADMTYIVLVVQPALTPDQLRSLLRGIKKKTKVIQVENNPYTSGLAEYDYRRSCGERVSLRDIAEENNLSYDTLRKYSARRNRERNT